MEEIKKEEKKEEERDFQKDYLELFAKYNESQKKNEELFKVITSFTNGNFVKEEKEEKKENDVTCDDIINYYKNKNKRGV